jgi:hypothetical protein
VNYAKLEDSIIQRLEPLRALGFEVVALPDRDSEYERPFKFGRVTVAYKNSIFSEDGHNPKPTIFSTNEIVQKETAELEIIIQARVLRTDKGVHWLKQAVTKQLVGHMPDSWGRLYIREYRFVEHADGIFTYALTLFTSGLVVQHNDPEILPILQQVTVLLGTDPANVISAASELASGATDPDAGLYNTTPGHSFSIKYEFFDPSGTPTNLTGYSFRWALKKFVTDPVPLALKTPTASGNVVIGGIGAIENIFAPGTYKAILEVINPSLVVEQEILYTVTSSAITAQEGGAYVFQTGVSFALKYEFFTPAGTPANFAGYTFNWALKASATSPALLTKTPQAAANVVFATVSPAENNFTPNTYLSILEVINPEGLIEQEIISQVIIEPQYI